MKCDWKHQPPAVVTEGQARETLFTLKQLTELEAGIDKRYGDKVKQLAANQQAEKVLEFDGVPDPVSFKAYAETLESRLTEYGLNRMEAKTLKSEGVGQIARRTGPDKISVLDSDQLSEVQESLKDRLVSLLKSLTLADLLSPEARKLASKERLKDLAAQSLHGLYRLEVKPDIDSLKASLKNGTLKPGDLSAIGFQHVAGEETVHLSLK